MVAGEEELVPIEIDGVPLRVARRGDHHELIVDVDGIEAGRLHLDCRSTRSHIIAVQNALASESLMKLLMIGDIVLMREQQPAYTTHVVDAFHQRPCEARRVDHGVTVRMLNQVAERAEGALSGESAAVHVGLDQFRVAGHRAAHVVLSNRTDRRGRAGDQCLLRLEQFTCAGRLMEYRGLIADVMEHRRRDLPAGVAVDAGGVDEEVAVDIRGVLEGNTSHRDA